MTDFRVNVVFSSDLPPAMPSFHRMSDKIRTQNKQKTVPQKNERLYNMHGSVGLKALFVKESFQKIKDHKQKFGPFIKEGSLVVNPDELKSLIKEVDCLIFELSSMLDFFSRELDIILGLGLGKKSDIRRIYKKCVKKCPGDSIAKKLINMMKSDWYLYFRKMRNRITHRLPIAPRTYGSEAYFPDDPESDDLFPTTSKHLSLIHICESWVNELLNYIDDSAEEIGKRVFPSW